MKLVNSGDIEENVQRLICQELDPLPRHDSREQDLYLNLPSLNPTRVLGGSPHLP